jgi:hypothetical protein
LAYVASILPMGLRTANALKVQPRLETASNCETTLASGDGGSIAPPQFNRRRLVCGNSVFLFLNNGLFFGTSVFSV